MAAILTAARQMFPDAPEPFIDLSTGINPHPYPLPALPPEIFARLPDRASVRRLAAIAAQCYGAPSADHVVPAPGTQILLPLVAALVRPGRAAILRTTYAEHARAASLAGHGVTERVQRRCSLRGADLAIVVNPNNPDGRIVPRAALLAIADELRPRGGLLIVDESFADVAPAGASLSRRSRARKHRRAAIVRKILRACGAAARLRAGRAKPRQTNSIDRSALGPLPVRLSWSGSTHWRTKPGGDGRLLLSQRPPNGSTSSSPGQVLKTSAAHRFTGSLDPPARMDYSIISGARAFWSGTLRRIRPGCDGDILTVRQIGSD